MQAQAILAVFFAVSAISAHAQPVSKSGADVSLAVSAGAASPLAQSNPVTANPSRLAPCKTGVLPALTAVKLAISQDIGSKSSRSGETISFVLFEPINLNGCEALPLGAKVTGEVVHAKKAGSDGAPGELIAAARFVEVGTRRLRLRSLEVVLTGADNILARQVQLAIGGAAGALVSPKSSKEPDVVVRTGTALMAKTAENFDLAASTEASSVLAAAPHGAVVPALTPIEIAIDANIGSKQSKSGQTFPIRLVSPIVIDGKEIVAGGALGIGEVVHAKKSSSSGAPGELVLAARYLEVAGRRLLLRSLHLSGVGKDNIATVDGLAIASATSPVPVALIGFMIKGGEKAVVKGSLATAKTAADFTIEAADTTITLPTPAAMPANPGGENK